MPAATAKKKRVHNRHPAAKGGAVSMQQLVRVANRWRDQYNPLRGLVISRVVQMLEAGERGEFADLQWLYRFVEKRFPVLRSVIVRRRAALQKLDWDIKIVSELPTGATQAMAEAQQQYLRSRYDLIENIRETITRLAHAEFRGFAILQKHRYDGGPHDGAIREFHWLPQWNWVRDGLFGDWYWNAEARSGVNAVSLGEDLRIDPADFLIREVEMPINEIGTLGFVNTSMAKKDWVAFVEMFGLPGCIIEMPPNIPTGEEDDYRDAAESVAEGVSGAIPNGATPHFPTSQIRGNSPFKEFLDAEKEDVVLAGTGGKLTMLNEATGIGGGQADVHQDVFDDLAQSEAGEISEILQKQFDVAELEAEFPGQPVLAYFELAAQDQEDADAYTERVVRLDGIGLRSDVAEVSEKTSMKLTDARQQPTSDLRPPTSDTDPPNPDDDDDEGAHPPIRNREPESTSLSDVQRLGIARAAELRPVLDRLSRIRQIRDPEIMRQRLAEFRAELPALLMDIAADSPQARVLEDTMRTAMMDGLIRNRSIRNNCGTGAGGFRPGNRCGSGGGNSSDKVGEFYDQAIASSGKEKKEIKWQAVSEAEAEAIKAATGIDAAGYSHAIDNFAVRHVHNQHGDPATEAPRGQLAVTKEDFERITDVINSPDSISHGGKTKVGRDAIVYRKRFNGTTIVVEEVRTGRKTLSLTSMRKMKNRATSHGGKPFSHTSETTSPGG